MPSSGGLGYHNHLIRIRSRDDKPPIVSILVLVPANGFFAAAEFSLVAVRRSRVASSALIIALVGLPHLLEPEHLFSGAWRSIATCRSDEVLAQNTGLVAGPHYLLQRSVVTAIVRSFARLRCSDACSVPACPNFGHEIC